MRNVHLVLWIVLNDLGRFYHPYKRREKKYYLSKMKKIYIIFPIRESKTLSLQKEKLSNWLQVTANNVFLKSAPSNQAKQSRRI